MPESLIGGPKMRDPCSTCEFYVPTAEANGAKRPAPLPPTGGECRRHPPTPSLVHTVFPVIVQPETTGCGEWAKKK